MRIKRLQLTGPRARLHTPSGRLSFVYDTARYVSYA